MKKEDLYIVGYTRKIGLGLLIRNDYMVFNTLQDSVASYPIIPGSGKNIFKYNPLHAATFGFQDFVFSKPTVALNE